MKILVLGGYGFIGSHICQQLKAEGHTIGIVDCYHQYYTFPDWEYHPVLNQRKSITGTDKEYIGQIESAFEFDQAGRVFVRPSTDQCCCDPC